MSRTTERAVATGLHELLAEADAEGGLDGDASAAALDIDTLTDLLAHSEAARHIRDVLIALGHGRSIELLVSDALMTTTEAAERLSVSRRILLRMIDSGELRAMTLPGSAHRRVPASEVARVLRERDELFWAPVAEDELPTAADLAAALAASAADAAA